ncbi:MAG: DUF3848 domain-containing protein [Lachnospiraceae bacterium]|nr:DUF3848 domain-containing protein [Lachnospiraceae bacterium]
MSIKSREQSIEIISNSVPPNLLKKAITNGYSDLALSFMADLKDEYLNKMLGSNFSANAVNKLTEAAENGKLGYGDLARIMRFAPYNARNEKYLDDMLNSIDKGVFPETAAKIFAAVGYAEMSYNDALDLVKSGAYYPTDYAGLSVEDDVAKELGKMGYPLRACEGFNYCYDIDSADRLAGALDRGAAITIPDKQLAVEIKKAIGCEDWQDFRNYIAERMEDKIPDLTGADIFALRRGFECEIMSEKLYNKVNAEYLNFISEMKKEPTDVVIGSAYEIVWKDDITHYLENEALDLSPKQFSALLSSKNTLDEIYGEWCSNGELHSYDDIAIALKDTAEHIAYSLEREQPPVIPEQKVEKFPEQKTEDKSAPKRKSR